ncbi:exported hypothetical protein [Verrucomicrobia bacterium]|nr:exported hypothetical protein [Verrucomicrobiota bacterium]
MLSTKAKYQYAVCALLAVVFGLFLWSSEGPPNDKQIRTRIARTWKFERPAPHFARKGTVTFASDGTYTSQVTFSLFGDEKTYEVDGTWEVKNGFIDTKVTTSDNPLAPVGRMTHRKIIHLDNWQFIYEVENGERMTWKATK